MCLCSCFSFLLFSLFSSLIIFQPCIFGASFTYAFSLFPQRETIDYTSRKLCGWRVQLTIWQGFASAVFGKAIGWELIQNSKYLAQFQRTFCLSWTKCRNLPFSTLKIHPAVFWSFKVCSKKNLLPVSKTLASSALMDSSRAAPVPPWNTPFLTTFWALNQ